MSFQDVNLSDLEANRDHAIDNLIKRGIGGSLSGDKFSSIHGGLIIYRINRISMALSWKGFHPNHFQ